MPVKETRETLDRLSPPAEVTPGSDAIAKANASHSALLAERDRADDDRNLLRRQLAAVEEAERKRLARELHDQLGQHLTAITLGLHDVATMLPANSPALDRLHSLQDLAQLLTRDARYLAIELRPPELDDVGLESAMSSYVDQWTKRYGIRTDFQSTSLEQDQRGGEAATMLYRVLQEALTNVAKHSRANHVSVVLEHSGADLYLIVEDDGAGFDFDETRQLAFANQHMGLAGMKERAALVNGVLIVESEIGRGTTIIARAPVT